jgi:predicted peptidase
VIDAFVSWALAEYVIDEKRVYLTALSCGAIGSWDYLAEHRGDVVAAAVLLSGNPGNPAEASSTWERAGHCDLGSVALWSLHGSGDSDVPFEPDRDTMQNLRACPSPPRRAAMFTDVAGGHNIWDPIFDLSAGHGDIYRWMLDNAKP